MKLLVGALLSISAHGGVLEDASQFSDWTHFWRTSCDQSYEAPHAIESLQSPNQTCPPKAGGGIPLIRELNGSLQTNAEDELFAKLATKQAAELKCSAQFAADCSAGKREDVIEAASQNLLALREAKKEWKDAVEPVMHLTVQSCPQTLAAVENEKPGEGATSSHYDVCKRLVSAKLAYATILNSIPFSNLPDVRESLKKFENGTDTDARGVLMQAYGKVQPTLQTESDRLTGVVAKNGGSSFDRSARYTLMDDPALVQSVVSDANDQKDVKGLVCSADARYHRGADALSTNITVGSLALGGMGAVVARTGILATRLSALIEASESAGGLSLQGARSLRVMSLVAGESANVASSYPSIVKNCGSGGPKITAHASDGKTCLSVPTAKQISQDSCILTHTMALLGSKSFKAGGFVGIKAASAAIGRSGVGTLEAAREKVRELSSLLRPYKQRELNARELADWDKNVTKLTNGTDDSKVSGFGDKLVEELAKSQKRETEELKLFRQKLEHTMNGRDEGAAEAALELQIALEICDKDPHGELCQQAIEKARKMFSFKPAQIQGKEDAELKPSLYLVKTLEFLDAKQRGLLKTELDAASKTGVPKYRATEGALSTRVDPLKVSELNQNLSRLLGSSVEIKRAPKGTKVELISSEKNLKVIVDPVERYFTVVKLIPVGAKPTRGDYLQYDLINGTLRPTATPTTDFADEWITKTHFSY